MGDELGIRFEGDNLEPFPEIEVGVLAFMQANVENQIRLVRHVRRLSKDSTQNSPGSQQHRWQM
jgi:hypothetical protein